MNISVNSVRSGRRWLIGWRKLSSLERRVICLQYPNYNANNIIGGRLDSNFSFRWLSTNSRDGATGSGIKKDSTEKESALKAPDNFYDDDIEEENLFLDAASVAISESGLENITTVKPITWDYLMSPRENLHDQSDFEKEERVKAEKELASLRESGSTDVDYDGIEQAQKKVGKLLELSPLEDPLMERMDELTPLGVSPDPGYLNYMRSVRTELALPDPLLDRFIPDTEPNKFRIDQQQDRACPGKLQRHGKLGVLQCHKIDLDDVNPFAIKLLEKYLSHDSEIMGKKLTGLCTKCQRKVAKTIKHSRNLGMLPHLGEFQRHDANPLVNESKYHKEVKGVKKVTSNTILK